MRRRKANTKLARYRAKRDFESTAEPRGEDAVAPAGRLRFVIQKHAATRLHYDLRLELDGVFKSWAVTRGPSLDPKEKRLAVEVEDHPLDYGDFEGTIPKGQYGGGTVQLWDRGHWAPEPGVAPQRALAEGSLKFRLDGQRLKGGWVLVRMKRRDREKRDNWLLIKHRDQSARSDADDALLGADRSIASGRSMAQIAAGKGRKPKPFMLRKGSAADAVWESNRGATRADRQQPRRRARTRRRKRVPEGKPLSRLPDFVPPQLCRLVDRAPEGPEWGHEVKLDGYRIQLRVERGRVQLLTRKGLDWTSRFPAIAAAAASLPDALIDGEICAIGAKGATDFAALQAAIADEDTDDLVYFAFDLMCLGRQDLRSLPLAQRKAALKDLLSGEEPDIRYVEHFEASGDVILRAACKMALEGIVSKRLDALYRSGRGDDWTKAKCRGGEEVVIGGWLEEARRFRSLLVGARHADHLVYLGKVGTGFSAAVVKRLMPKLAAVASKVSPFQGANAPRKKAGVRWAKPELVAEIEFAGWTGGGMVRQASFKGLREDKPADEVVAEKARTPTPSGRRKASTATTPRRTSAAANAPILGVTLSNPDKPLWPGSRKESAITKRELALYYQKVGPWMIDHLKGRPCSIVRAPDGMQGELFFQRHAMKGSSSLITLVRTPGDRKPYIQFDSVEALIAAAQIAALELHPWNNRPGDPQTPGRIVFDLDPAPDLPFARVTEAAKELRDRLEALGLVAFCKTTGGKGLHVVTPLKGTGSLCWPDVKAFARLVCHHMMSDSPDRYVINMAKKVRKGKIFLDYLRNDITSTAVAPLSPRARAGAPVSMPLNWSQVRGDLDPGRYTLRSAPKVVARMTAWEDYADGARPFAAAARRLTKRSP